MVVPVKRFNKKEIEWLGTNYCQHGHTYLEHYDCFLKDKPDTSPVHERVGYLDIESNSLNANFGYAYSYAILDGDTEKIYGRVLRPSEIRRGIFDKRLMKELISDLHKFDRIVVYFGADHRFDIPFLRTRCLYYRLEFPLYRDIWVTDVWPMVRNKLKLHSSRLQVVCEFLGIPAKNHPMNYANWVRAQAGFQDALDYIWAHNKEDVFSLRDVHVLMDGFLPRQKRSL